MKQKKVVLLIDSRHYGGIEAHVEQLALLLVCKGWQPEIWLWRRYSDSNHTLEQFARKVDLPICYLNGIVSFMSALLSGMPLLLHTHGYKANIVGRLTAWLFKVPVVSTFHNGDPGTGRISFYNWLDKMTSGLSSNIAVSQPIADGLPVKATIIPNFLCRIKESFLKKNGPFIAFVGRLSEEKGADQFLAMAGCYPNYRFRVYGSGPQESMLQRLAPSNVQLMGHVQMTSVWKDVQLLCITSRYEGLPMVALEAMAHGIPVVAFSVGALPWVIRPEYNGWLAEPRNISSMGNLVQYWQSMSLEEQQTIKKNSYDWVKRFFSGDAVWPVLSKVYCRAVSRKSGSRIMLN
ncbi:2-deoxystreptamine glucosyltransferase [invertebrate metagenome]|uniref:2-deoxystreptamine glucosyltransferase n=1 Tax=invertebrate metagenome TaxID=1711999 RepID=A0A2H9TCJ5_9ZZZZ